MTLSNATAKVAAVPKAKTTDIVVQELEDEMLVYDLENDKAHHLNETVSFVWKKCDGKTSVNEIAVQLSNKLDQGIEADFVHLALDELGKANLLDANPGELIDLTRRKVLFRYAPMAAVLPVVMSLVAPEPVHAQSCLANGMNCDPLANPDPCCPPLSCSCEGSCC